MSCKYSSRTTIPINILTDDDSKYSDSDYSSGSEEDEDLSTYKTLYVEEDEHVNFFRDFVPITVDGLESMVFSTTDLEALKQKEQNLREKESNKYFRCKLTTPALYRQITEAIAPYLLEDKLIMLAHRWSTQLNEAMNNLVQAYAPKTKNFSGTISLRTRVGIAAGILALGYEAFWTLVFRELKVEMDTDFRSTLQARDKKKAGKRASQKSIKGKVRRRQTFMSKFHEAHKEQMNDAITRKTYGAGVAVKAAKKTAKDKHTAAERNPEGTPKDQMRCAYHHPLYCTVLAHTTPRVLMYGMWKCTDYLVLRTPQTYRSSYLSNHCRMECVFLQTVYSREESHVRRT